MAESLEQTIKGGKEPSCRLRDGVPSMQMRSKPLIGGTDYEFRCCSVIECGYKIHSGNWLYCGYAVEKGSAAAQGLVQITLPAGDYAVSGSVLE